MAPKKADKQVKEKDRAKDKERAKVAEDKTFGLKNKNKSKVVQRFVAQVQVNAKTVDQRKREEQKAEEKQSKAKAKQQAAFLAGMFGLQTDKKGNLVKKEKKEVERKMDLFVEQREQLKQNDGEDAEWRKTDITCKHFLTACEKDLYGWRWKCPDGDGCKYRHCLPEGYVLDKDKPKKGDELAEDMEELEARIEEERRALPPGGTPVNAESFKSWCEKKEKERLEQLEKARVAASKNEKGGRGLTVLTGKDLFAFDASLFVDDDAAAAMDDYDEEEMDENEGGEGAAEAPAQIDADVFLDEDLPVDLDDLDDEE